MKINILTILLLVCSVRGISQDFENFDVEFTKSFYKNFRVPQNYVNDSLGKTLMLHIFINKNTDENNVEFSDNASISLRSELSRIIGNLKFESFRKYMTANKQNELNILFPVFIRTQYSNRIDWPGDVYTTFNGNTINKLCILRPPIQIVIYKSVH